MSVSVLMMVVALMGCGGAGDGNVNEADCGEQACPVGTAFAEDRADREGFELGVGVDPATYSGEVAFKRFGESECSYVCETISPCPDLTFPVISAECFTCGTVGPDGEVDQGSCSDL